jgi:LPS O-antigen subunit length determinant protein (WzzB/FepE family)
VKILYDLIESQQNKKMLASVKDEYAFKTIDPPIAPEKKYSPNRPLILVLFTLLGGFFAVLIVLIQFFRRY